jgi:hypothetical protein
MTKTKHEDMILGMCYTLRHDFGLLDENQQINIKIQMNQLFEHNIKEYILSLEKSCENAKLRYEAQTFQLQECSEMTTRYALKIKELELNIENLSKEGS